MQVTVMNRRAATIAALVLALAAVVAFGLLSAGAHPAQAAVKHSAKHAKHHVRHAERTGGTDADNVQSGDQTSSDTSSASSESSGESSVESEQGQPGEPANGNQDPAGSAGSTCDGNCTQ